MSVEYIRLMLGKNGWIRNYSFSSHTHWARIAFLGVPANWIYIDCVQYLWHVNSVPGAHRAHSAHQHRIFLFNWNSVVPTTIKANRIWSKMSICVDLFINNSMSCCAAPLSFSHRTFIDRQLVASQLIAARWHLTTVQFIVHFSAPR